jgi:hypothetical protein
MAGIVAGIAIAWTASGLSALLDPTDRVLCADSVDWLVTDFAPFFVEACEPTSPARASVGSLAAPAARPKHKLAEEARVEVVAEAIPAASSDTNPADGATRPDLPCVSIKLSFIGFSEASNDCKPERKLSASGTADGKIP